MIGCSLVIAYEVESLWHCFFGEKQLSLISKMHKKPAGTTYAGAPLPVRSKNVSGTIHSYAEKAFTVTDNMSLLYVFRTGFCVVRFEYNNVPYW